MDVVALTIDERRHLGIPALLTVAEMGTRLEQLAHGKFWQSHEFSLLYRLARRAGYSLQGNTGRRRQNTCRKPPARARWRAYTGPDRP
jgi:hypothetical protein